MIVVTFRSRLREDVGPEYDALAERMESLARTMSGFVSFATYVGDDGARVSIAEFETDADVLAWRQHPEHVEAQRLGRERFYATYRVTVSRVERDYAFEAD